MIILSLVAATSSVRAERFPEVFTEQTQNHKMVMSEAAREIDKLN